jgi:hypothetical protein
MSTRMAAEFRSSELLLELEFARDDEIIGISSAVIVMNQRLQIRSKVTVMRFPSLDSQRKSPPIQIPIPARDQRRGGLLQLYGCCW